MIKLHDLLVPFGQDQRVKAIAAEDITEIAIEVQLSRLMSTLEASLSWIVWFNNILMI